MLPASSPPPGTLAQYAKVTLGVAVIGGLAGAAVGITTSTVILLAAESLQGALGLLTVGGVIGGGCGLVLGPTVAWTLLREVPLGRAALETAVAGAIGGVAGFALSQGNLLGFIGGILMGLVPAVLHLKWRFRRRG